MLQIPYAGMLESLRLVVEEGADGASQGNDGNGCWRFEAWNQADQIATQDEESQRHQKRREAFTMVSDDFFALPDDETVGSFEYVLQGARFIHRKPRAHKKEDNNQEKKD